jgi:hypothetical protein
MDEQRLLKIEQLLKDNLELSRKIFEDSEKTRKYIMWQRILGIVKVVLIVVPLLIALYVLPPLLSQVISSYSSVFNQLNAGSGAAAGVINADTLKTLLGR